MEPENCYNSTPMFGYGTSLFFLLFMSFLKGTVPSGSCHDLWDLKGI